VSVSDISIGILMLNTSFQRLCGDIGHPDTWDFPVHYRVVDAATQGALFGQGADRLLEPFALACEELAALGVKGITTSCGFLAALQPQLSARSPVPVATSALMQIPMVQSLIGPARRIGVITVDAAALTHAHFAGVGVDMNTTANVQIAGLPVEGVIWRDLRGNASTVDPQAQAEELCAVGRALVSAHPDIGALVLECTNLAPHAKALQLATGLPVFDIVTLVNWFRSALVARAWPHASC